MKINFSLLLVLFGIILNAQLIGIGTKTPNTNSVLDVSSTTKGVLIPRLTVQEILDIDPTSGENGLFVYNKTENCINFWNGTYWQSLCGSGNNCDPSNLGQFEVLCSYFPAVDSNPYRVGVNESRTIVLPVNVLKAGPYLIKIESSDHSIVYIAQGDFTASQVNTTVLVSLAGTGLPNTTSLYFNVYANGSKVCSYTKEATLLGIVLKCNEATYKSGNVLKRNSPSTLVYKLPYTSPVTSVYPTYSVFSTGVTGLTATINTGTFTTTGNLDVNITGTPTDAGIANFVINLGGAMCIISVPVITDTETIGNCSIPNEIVGRSLSKSSSNPTILNIKGKNVGVWITSTAGLLTGVNQFCSPGIGLIGAMCGVNFANSLNDIMRIQGNPTLNLATGSLCNNGSITIHFTKPVNDFTVFTTWIGSNSNTLLTADEFNITTDSPGTIAAFGSINDCNYVQITNPNSSTINILGIQDAVNSNYGGGAVRVRATVPYTSLTLTGVKGDDVIVAYGYCDAAVY